MSLNFPTAFWKADTVPVVDDFVIEWSTSLASSYGNQGVGIGVTNPSFIPPEDFVWSTGDTNRFPFGVLSDEDTTDFFYSEYIDTIWQGNQNPASTTPFFGWYQDGGSWGEGNSIDLSPTFHRSNPWIINGFERTNEIHIFFEADVSSAIYDMPPWPWEEADIRYNNFIQSGNATGTFDIKSSQVGKNLVVKVSGLGEDAEYLPGARTYDVMSLYLDRPSVASDDFICSGAAPMDNRNTRNLDTNMDMQQVKLYTGSNIYSPANSDPANETAQDTTASPVGWTEYGNGGGEYETPSHADGSEREEGSVGNGGIWSWGSYLVSGTPRANPTQRVDQNTRTTYTTSAGVGTFTVSDLQLGIHKIKIDTSSVDGTWTSGAFYGFYFTLVD